MDRRPSAMNIGVRAARSEGKRGGRKGVVWADAMHSLVVIAVQELALKCFRPCFFARSSKARTIVYASLKGITVGCQKWMFATIPM